jgi:hypothetical protein
MITDMRVSPDSILTAVRTSDQHLYVPGHRIPLDIVSEFVEDGSIEPIAQAEGVVTDTHDGRWLVLDPPVPLPPTGRRRTVGIAQLA